MPLDVLEAALPAATPVVRVNPNSPSLVGEGFNPVTYGSGVTGPSRSLVDRFLTALGASVEIRDQAMNLYTALTAVGPTYFLPVLDAMITAGMEGGLTPRGSGYRGDRDSPRNRNASGSTRGESGPT